MTSELFFMATRGKISNIQLPMYIKCQRTREAFAEVSFSMLKYNKRIHRNSEPILSSDLHNSSFNLV